MGNSCFEGVAAFSRLSSNPTFRFTRLGAKGKRGVRVPGILIKPSNLGALLKKMFLCRWSTNSTQENFQRIKKIYLLNQTGFEVKWMLLTNVQETNKTSCGTYNQLMFGDKPEWYLSTALWKSHEFATGLGKIPT